MRYIAVLLLITLLTACSPSSTNPEQDKKELTDLVNEFLEKVDSKDMHNRFWADDLIYTSSSGARFGKEQIMSGFKDESTSDDSTDNSSKMTYSAEDIQIQIYDKTAVVAFELVGKTGETTLNYLNSGTFVKRNGIWVVVNWQATKKAS